MLKDFELTLAQYSLNTVLVQTLDTGVSQMPRKKKTKKAVISDQDIEVLKFLWKWKISTTAALAEKFYPHKNARRGYERLRVLEEAGVIESRADARARKFIWMITKKGFLTIIPHLPPLKEDGYRSAAPGHDLLSAAVMLSDWHLNPVRGVTLISEQQLCRYEDPLLDLAQPYGTSHRADGYWVYARTKAIIALEVQLSHQKSETYRHMVDFYKLNENKIRQILWVVLTKGMAKKVQDYLEQINGDLERHQFVLAKHFIKDGWAAKVDEGSLKGKPIKTLLWGYLGGFDDDDSVSHHKLLLDLRKSPHIAKKEVQYEPLDTWI